MPDHLPPTDFHHPYTPYQIQTDFMRALYTTIDDKCIGIFESPTGTGKSLSLICGALTWLREKKRREVVEGEVEAADEDGEAKDEPDWVMEHERKERIRVAAQRTADLDARLLRIRARERRAEKEAQSTLLNARSSHNIKRIRPTAKKLKEREEEEDEYVVDDYQSEQDEGPGKRATVKEGEPFSKEVMDLLRKMGHPAAKADEADDDDDEEMPEETKIFYASRTHSQLTQFINELRRVKFPPITLDTSLTPSSSTSPAVEEGLIKHLPLASRQHLCINPPVRSLRSTPLITAACLDLQKPTTPPTKRCPYLPSPAHPELLRPAREFRDEVLAEIRDIEDLGRMGREMGVCGYYASRGAIRAAEVVTLPYPLLLNKNARESLGVDVKGHVVVVDEAHNVLDAISGVYAAEIGERALRRARRGLEVYVGRFSGRLKGGNKVYIKQTLRLIAGLEAFLEGKKVKGGVVEEGEVSAAELLGGRGGADMVNVYKLEKYFKVSQLARKVDSYVEKLERDEAKKKMKENGAGGKVGEVKSGGGGGMPVLMQLQAFLMVLTNPSSEGRIFYGPTTSSTSSATGEDKKAEEEQQEVDMGLRYMLLDPAHHFRSIVTSARAVILAGGTMEPMSDYVQHLFPYLPPTRIRTFSCGHVIPPENLLGYAVSRGPSGGVLEFTWEKRGRREVVEELGRAVVNLCGVVPDGVVVFFASYGYLESVVGMWKVLGKGAGGVGMSLWERLGQKKKIFRESKEGSNVEDTLRDYAQAIDAANSTGAILLSVVGGKMSEGINFSDKLGRAVIMVGLPFPNPSSPEWKAKREHVEHLVISAGGTPSEAKAASQEFYENACMRAVNQGIGRAIRHRGDYASIVLLDRRYGTERIRGKLPGWIREKVVVEEKGFGEVVRAVGGFFRQKRGQ
ncbi:DNA repair helicase [Saitoella complicata NRRL Y-17804]|uniref:DNA repair helicase n=1 Tax=Saitoella complicata (strain BCRC 22490 / CBS 7301 / JCM 7358 / NBRC 10748 / NRRL Y-17804) TaxID=698492 RepID=UPI000866AC0D|nr:DNA repair helicase [Saitoella complicata NRRL Y-17804]ODQ49660.1 DNA repair helicase [Saitoella complicata NRRL Y-17804]